MSITLDHAVHEAKGGHFHVWKFEPLSNEEAALFEATRKDHWRCNCGMDTFHTDTAYYASIPNYSGDPRLFLPLLEELLADGYCISLTTVGKDKGKVTIGKCNVDGLDHKLAPITNELLIGEAVCEAWLKKEKEQK